MKKVVKTTRTFRYDLNQIPNDYTVEVINRFKGLDLIECLMNYGWRFMTLYRRQRSRPSPWKRNAKKHNGYLRRYYSNANGANSNGGCFRPRRTERSGDQRALG